MKLWVTVGWATLGVLGCGSTPCPPGIELLPMTAGRAMALAPQVETGLAVTTTEIYGDCREKPMSEEAGCPGDEACARVRAGLTVYVAPANQSLPNGSSCGKAFEVEGLAPHLVAQTPAPQGEVVVTLAPGTYLALLSVDGLCADCGSFGAGEPCVVEVRRGQVTLRDLVLDRSTR